MWDESCWVDAPWDIVRMAGEDQFVDAILPRFGLEFGSSKTRQFLHGRLKVLPRPQRPRSLVLRLGSCCERARFVSEWGYLVEVAATAAVMGGGRLHEREKGLRSRVVRTDEHNVEANAPPFH